MQFQIPVKMRHASTQNKGIRPSGGHDSGVSYFPSRLLAGFGQWQCMAVASCSCSCSDSKDDYEDSDSKDDHAVPVEAAGACTHEMAMGEDRHVQGCG